MSGISILVKHFSTWLHIILDKVKVALIVTSAGMQYLFSLLTLSLAGARGQQWCHVGVSQRSGVSWELL